MKKLFCLFIILACSLPGFSKEKLPNGYRSLKLGMSLDEIKAELVKDSDFGFHGDRDVSLVPGSGQILIETDGTNKYQTNYISQCWFQFYQDRLYTMTININTRKIDYYSMFKALSTKYGEPNSLDPKKATWQNEDITLILEKPLSVKYIDNKTKDELSNYSVISQSAEELTKQMFIDEF